MLNVISEGESVKGVSPANYETTMPPEEQEYNWQYNRAHTFLWAHTNDQK